MNPMFDTLSDFNKLRMQRDPRHKLWHRLQWVHDEAAWRLRNSPEPAKESKPVPIANMPKSLVADGKGGFEPNFKVYLVVYGAGPEPVNIHYAQLDQKLILTQADAETGRPASIRVEFAFETGKPGSCPARGFWVQPSLRDRLKSELNSEELTRNEIQRFLDAGYATNARRHELLAAAPEMDGQVKEGHGFLEAEVPEEISLPGRSDFIHHHPLLIIAVQTEDLE